MNPSLIALKCYVIYALDIYLFSVGISHRLILEQLTC